MLRTLLCCWLTSLTWWIWKEKKKQLSLILDFTDCNAGAVQGLRVSLNAFKTTEKRKISLNLDVRSQAGRYLCLLVMWKCSLSRLMCSEFGCVNKKKTKRQKMEQSWPMFSKFFCSFVFHWEYYVERLVWLVTANLGRKESKFSTPTRKQESCELFIQHTLKRYTVMLRVWKQFVQWY